LTIQLDGFANAIAKSQKTIANYESLVTRGDNHFFIKYFYE